MRSEKSESMNQKENRIRNCIFKVTAGYIIESYMLRGLKVLWEMSRRKRKCIKPPEEHLKKVGFTTFCHEENGQWIFWGYFCWKIKGLLDIFIFLHFKLLLLITSQIFGWLQCVLNFHHSLLLQFHCASLQSGEGKERDIEIVLFQDANIVLIQWLSISLTFPVFKAWTATRHITRNHLMCRYCKVSSKIL